MTEAELAYRVRQQQIILDGALRTGDPYGASSAAQVLSQLAVYYPQQVCRAALEADAMATDMPANTGHVSPSLGLVQRTCQGYQ
jgi:hypothetical protein